MVAIIYHWKSSFESSSEPFLVSGAAPTLSSSTTGVIICLGQYPSLVAFPKIFISYFNSPKSLVTSFLYKEIAVAESARISNEMAL